MSSNNRIKNSPNYSFIGVRYSLFNTMDEYIFIIGYSARLFIFFRLDILFRYDIF